MRFTGAAVDDVFERWLSRVAVAILGDDGAPTSCDRHATGIDALDDALEGGVPVGRIVEVYGGPETGKSTFASLLVRAWQRNGETAVFVDVERSFDPARAAALGVDLERLVVLRPTTGEAAFQAVETLVKRRVVDLIVIDSIAALVPAAELALPLGDAAAGLHARLLSGALRRLHAALFDARCTLVCVNQTRVAFADDGKAALLPTGGHALSFYAATRLELKAGASPTAVVRKTLGSQAGARVLWRTPDPTDRARALRGGSIQKPDRPTKSDLGHSAEEGVGQPRTG